MDTLYRIQSIFREVLDDPTLKITMETSTENLPEWDSVATVQIVLAAEEEFGIRFTADGLASVHSVADLVRFLDNHSGEA